MSVSIHIDKYDTQSETLSQLQTEYFRHLLQVGTKTETSKLQQNFIANRFRRDEDDGYIRSGYSENSRVLKRENKRLRGIAIACLPNSASLDVTRDTHATIDTL
jgi:GTP-dependent phosphoenolpyruvate carboxykinase